MTPVYRLPDEITRRRQATVAELTDAVSAARCSARLAGMETDEFVVRELLLAVMGQLDRAIAAVRRLG